jgi:hypothetical protein
VGGEAIPWKSVLSEAIPKECLERTIVAAKCGKFICGDQVTIISFVKTQTTTAVVCFVSNDDNDNGK